MGLDQPQVSKYHLIILLMSQSCVQGDQMLAILRAPCPMCFFISKWDVFKWANSYTDNSLAGPVGLMESLAQSRGCFSSCGDVETEVRWLPMRCAGRRWEINLSVFWSIISFEQLKWLCQTTEEFIQSGQDRILSFNSRNKMATSLTRKGDRKSIGTLFPYYYTYWFN